MTKLDGRQTLGVVYYIDIDACDQAHKHILALFIMRLRHHASMAGWEGRAIRKLFSEKYVCDISSSPMFDDAASFSLSSR